MTTATGEQRRNEIGNATANIAASEVVENSTVTSLNDLLNSRAPGVTVTSGTQTGHRGPHPHPREQLGQSLE